MNGEEPFKFTTLETLEMQSPLWVVSMPEMAFRAANGAQHPFLRHADFLPTPLTFIAQELGAGDAAAAPVGAQRASEVLTRVASMAGDFCGEVFTRLLEDGQESLTTLLQAATAPALRVDALPAELQNAMPSLFKAPPGVAAPHAQDTAVRLPANRLRLMQVMMTSAVPAGDWREVDIGAFPNAKSALSWVIGDLQPAICSVTVRAPLPGVLASAPMLRNLTQGATRWMALPELVAMSRYVDMVPKRIFVAEEYVPVQASLKVPPPVFSPAAAASVSAGLFAEAYAHAACGSAARRFNDEGAATQSHSLRAAWLTAVARSYMMQEAMTLTEAGFSVMAFDRSHILVGVARRNLRFLRKAVSASKLLSYPTALRMMEEKGVRPVGELVAEGVRD